MRIIILILMAFSLSIASSVVIDKKTNIMWQDNRDSKSLEKDYNSAKNYCKKLNLNGYDDWYLPTYEQLLTITDKSKYNPSIKSEFKNITSNGNYWSSSPNVSYSKYAWNVYSVTGEPYNFNKTTKLYVRCARAGQSDTLNFDTLISTLIKKELENIPKPPSELSLVRDEFETTAEFNSRVAKTKRNQKKIVAKYQKKYKSTKQKAQKNAIKKALEITWGKPLLSNLHYDADNGYFVANISFEAKKYFKKKVAIKVERKNARSFKNQFSSLRAQAIFDYDGSSVKLKEINVPYKNKSYLAQFTDLSIDDTRVAVNLRNDLHVEHNFNTNITVAQNSVSSFDTSKLKDFRVLDRLLAKSSQVKTDKKRWLFVVGIEQYEYTDNISYAKRSAEMFVKIIQKKLGVKKQNSYVMINRGATQATIKTNMKKMLRRVKAGDTIYFYYNGHGVPIPALKNAPYMLASDTEPDFVADEKFFSLQNIYNKLSDSKASKIVAVVDSCFSGVTDAKAVLKGVAATKMVAKSVSFDKDKMVVMSAGKANQYSNGYNKKGYRLFSFFVMKNILEGDTSIKQLYKDTKTQTYDTSIEEYGDSRTQEPTIEGNFRMEL